MAKPCTCVKCWRNGNLQKHHWLPQKWFGKSDKFIYVCNDCHKEITEILPHSVKLNVDQYREIHRKWLQGQTPLVIMEGRNGNRYRNQAMAYRSA